jgi:LPXTG-motif cell wall-anchored protein
VARRAEKILKEQTMNRKLILSLMLATGFALAQSGSSDNQSSQPGSNPQSTPSAQQPSTPPQQNDQNPALPGATGQTATSSANAQESVVRGCLKQSGGDWVLSEAGQNITIKGDDSMLKPHNGHQVEVHGTRGSDPSSLQVTSVNMISDSCTTGQASATGVPDTTSTASAGAANSNNPSSTTGQTAASPASSTATPDQTQNPSATQTPSASAAASGTSSEQTPASPSGTAGQNAGNTGAAAGNTSDQNTSANSQQLPQTASPLPLLGLLGLGSLASGLIVRRKK